MCKRRSRAWLGALLIVACRAAPLPPAPSDTPYATATAPVARPPPTASSAAAEAPPDLDPAEAPLARATIDRLAPRREGSHVFDATLVTPDGELVARAAPALAAAPTALRTRLAFARLARAIGAEVVPVARLRSFPVGELAAALDRYDARATSEILGRLRVENDGTVDLLLSSPSASSTGAPWRPLQATPVSPQGAELARVERWAQASTPSPKEDPKTLRQLVEMLVLDYLAGNVARVRAELTPDGALVLEDNASAFPLLVDRSASDRLLRKLRAVVRFPRGLDGGLRRLTREASKELFDGGDFETWLLSPRTLIELDERRAALLTLIEARVAERGADAVLSL